MSASPFAWFFGILFALPIWFLVGALLVVVARLFLQWLVDDGSATGAKLSADKANTKTALKG